MKMTHDHERKKYIDPLTIKFKDFPIEEDNFKIKEP